MNTNQNNIIKSEVETALKEIGAVLKAKRVEKHISLEDVHVETRISMRYLASIEEGDRRQFPAEVYLVGTIKRYALFLDIDPFGLIEKYRMATNFKPSIQLKQSRASENDGNRAFLTFILIIAGIFSISLFIYRSRHNEDQKEYSKHIPAAACTTVTTQDFGPAPLPAPIKKKTDELELQIKIIENTWLKVTADDITVFEGMLSKGQEKSFNAKTKFVLKIGYVPGVKARLNGKEINVSQGAQQDVNEIVLTKSSLKM